MRLLNSCFVSNGLNLKLESDFSTKLTKLFFILTLSCSFTLVSNAQGTNKVLVEVFTNSHCSYCGQAYTNLNNTVFNQEFAKDMVFVAYHVNTYSDDKLYQETKSESIPRANWYSGISGTPTFFINGKKYTQGNLSDNIQTSINANKTIDIGLTCTLEKDSLVINSELMNNNDYTNLKYFIVVAENVKYKGRNGHERHRNVMRTMPTTPAGESISLSQGKTTQLTKKIAINTIWNLDSISVIGFVQNDLTKEVYNTAIITKDKFFTASVKEETIDGFSLSPIPSNGIINLKFNSTNSSKARLSVYSLEGKLIAERQVIANDGVNSLSVDLTEQNISKGVYTYLLELEGKKQKGSLIIN